ncbi:hypothetical protein [Amycolatopsis sp. NPDC051102]|uniref:hypothetical protein n=1 Tax=Amycolatopsis sp. NPDC051102 TaxID=3155163 RepID=UPI00342925A7
MPTSNRPAPGSSAPTLEQAAKIVTEASNDPGWGLFIWLGLTVDVRHDELSRLRWRDVMPETRELTVGQRRVVVGEHTSTLLHAYSAHCAAQAAILDVEQLPDAYVFSLSPEGGTPPEYRLVSERYSCLCSDLGWTMRLDQLPHYPEAELVAAGVDVSVFTWRLQRGLSRIQRRPAGRKPAGGC